MFPTLINIGQVFLSGSINGNSRYSFYVENCIFNGFSTKENYVNFIDGNLSIKDTIFSNIIVHEPTPLLFICCNDFKTSNCVFNYIDTSATTICSFKHNTSSINSTAFAEINKLEAPEARRTTRIYFDLSERQVMNYCNYSNYNIEDSQFDIGQHLDPHNQTLTK